MVAAHPISCKSFFRQSSRSQTGLTVPWHFTMFFQVWALSHWFLCISYPHDVIICEKKKYYSNYFAVVIVGMSKIRLRLLRIHSGYASSFVCTEIMYYFTCKQPNFLPYFYPNTQFCKPSGLYCGSSFPLKYWNIHTCYLFVSLDDTGNMWAGAEDIPVSLTCIHICCEIFKLSLTLMVENRLLHSAWACADEYSWRPGGQSRRLCFLLLMVRAMPSIWNTSARDVDFFLSLFIRENSGMSMILIVMVNKCE